VAVLALVASAHAGPRTSELPRRQRMTSAVTPAAVRASFAPLAARGWRAAWDGEVVLALWGGTVAAPGASADAAIAERAARAFLAAHLELFAPGASLRDFQLVANRLDGDVRSIGFAQTWRGVPVHGGQIGFVFGRDRLFAVSSGAWPHVDASPWVSRAKQREVMRVGAGYQLVDVIDDGDAASYVGRDGRVIAREPHARDATSTLKFNVGRRYASGERIDAAAPFANLTVNGTPTTTAATGAFAWGTALNATVVPSADGTYVGVSNTTGFNATDTLTAQPGQPLVWDLSADELADSQLSAYVYVSAAKARARIVNPGAASWLDTKVAVFVNEAPECNATADRFRNQLHFQRATASCENSARVADVVDHELAHLLHWNSIIAGMGAYEAQLTEGLADFFAANMTEDSGVGRGLGYDDVPLRDIDPVGIEKMYPQDLDPIDAHVGGLIISGALWDLRKALIRELGTSAGIARTERIFTGIMQRALDISTTFNAALIADDDDADLGNGTPSYCAIERAFGNHGLVPGFVPTRVSTPVVTGFDVSVTVDVPAATTCAPLGVTAIEVTWKTGDQVASTFELVPDGNTWRGAFPAQPDFTTIAYTVDVIFDDGSVLTYPNNPADPAYQTFVGTPAPILCATMDDDPQWDQTTNMGFEWEWATPSAPAASGDPSAAFTGTQVLGTDVTGDGVYRPGLLVSIAAPSVAVGKYERVHLQYRRWLTVEDARYDQATILANEAEVWRNASLPSGILDHVDREWRFHDVDLTPYVADGQVQVRWTLTSDGTKELGGWALDDVCIVGIDKVRACGDGEVDLGEQCDDLNTKNGDGCDDHCHFEIQAGGGGFCDARRGAGGSWLLILLSAAVAARAGGRRDPSRNASRSRPAGRAGRR